MAEEIGRGIATFRLPDGRSPVDVETIQKAVASGGPAFFPRHRWFGDKARHITESSVVAVNYAERADDDPFPLVLTVIEIGFSDGGSERYFVPFAVVPDGPISAQTLAKIEQGSDQSLVIDDAVARPEFHQWLLDPVTGSPETESNMGRIIWRPGPGYGAARTGLGPVASRVSGAEQSNSAVIFGTDLLAKVFRKLRPGLNPDIEISRFLSTQADFGNYPELLGDLTYVTADGSTYSIGMMLPFIPNYGDAWAYTLSILGDMLLGGTGADPVAPLHLLGTRTGELHRALASSSDDPAFAAEPVSRDDIAAWSFALEQSIERTINALQVRSDQLSLDWRQRLTALSVNSPGIAERIRGFDHLKGANKIRVHGDYHLGQVLVTLDHDFVILDFEGEPTRPMHERRAKTSPLKDVAGMLRSLSYARFAALRARPDEIPEHEAAARLVDWEKQARTAFLSGYRSVTAKDGANYLPAVDDAFMAALAAWELDKAIYEVNYEINNRPDWLSLPLEALLGTSA